MYSKRSAPMPPGKMTDAGLARTGKCRLPGRRRVRRPVHRQHHVHGDGNDRALSHGLQQRARHGSAERPGCLRLRRASHESACARAFAPRDILTRPAFDNAIAGVAATGGSTNAVLHLLAIAREAGVPLHIDDFQKVSERTPLLADLKPSGRFVAADMHRAGGIRLFAAARCRASFSTKARSP